jgi:hypothetical protein
MEYFYKQRYLKDIGLVETCCWYFDYIAACWIQNLEMCLLQEIFLSYLWAAQLLSSIFALHGCISWQYRVHFLPRIQLILFHRNLKVLTCGLQAGLAPSEILYVMWLSSCLEILTTSLQILSFNSCKECEVTV